MTAFARAELEAPWGNAQWELRSVNNRYLDAAVKLPDDLRALEPAVRERVRSGLARGKVDCLLRVAWAPSQAASFTIDVDLVRRLADATRQVDQILHDPARVNAVDLLRWPGVIQSATVDLEAVGEGCLALLDQALEDLGAMRAREGERIAEMIAERLDGISDRVSEVRERVPELVEAARERLRGRLLELTEQLDPERLEQEVALLAHKADVAEELDRLEAHVAEVRGALRERKPVGRRLDFLMQELNREANTLGSKSSDARTTRASVDLKVLIEQMREQIQNIE